MKEITITIDAENDAFQPDPLPEVARILRTIADRLDAGEDLEGLVASDNNGNRCATVTVSPPRINA